MCIANYGAQPSEIGWLCHWFSTLRSMMKTLNGRSFNKKENGGNDTVMVTLSMISFTTDLLGG